MRKNAQKINHRLSNPNQKAINESGRKESIGSSAEIYEEIEDIKEEQVPEDYLHEHQGDNSILVELVLCPDLSHLTNQSTFLNIMLLHNFN